MTKNMSHGFDLTSSLWSILIRSNFSLRRSDEHYWWKFLIFLMIKFTWFKKDFMTDYDHKKLDLCHFSCPVSFDIWIFPHTNIVNFFDSHADHISFDVRHFDNPFFWRYHRSGSVSGRILWSSTITILEWDVYDEVTKVLSLLCRDRNNLSRWRVKSISFENSIKIIGFPNWIFRYNHNDSSALWVPFADPENDLYIYDSTNSEEFFIRREMNMMTSV